MAIKTYGIHEIAAEFDRLFADDPEIVNETETSWGHGTEAGHIGHEHDGEPSVVGWYCDGGNAGHAVMSIENDDLQRAGEVLAGMESAESLCEIERAFAESGVRYERLA